MKTEKFAPEQQALVELWERHMASEFERHDQAGLLVQLGLLDAEKLPVVGAERARRLVDPTTPANRLIDRARRSA
ncbi:MAG TPA: hypothetical protein VFD92_00560 [Candidatus Binatia bacterium]|nr:hypothetical protein [Candidatus Binatia bacterium]